MNNNLETTTNVVAPIPPKKSSSKVIIVILLLIVIAMGGFITYDKVLKDKYFTKKTDNKDNKSKENNKENNDISKIDIQPDSDYDNYVKKEHKYKINGKDILITNMYYYNNERPNGGGETVLYRKIYVDSKKIDDIDYDNSMIGMSYNIIEEIEKYNNEFEISTINDVLNDDEYLVLDIDFGAGRKKYLIVNENGEVLKNIQYDYNAGYSNLVFDTKEEANVEIISGAISEVNGKYAAFDRKAAYIDEQGTIWYIDDFGACEKLEYRKFNVENGAAKDTLIKTYYSSDKVYQCRGQR